MRGLVRLVCRGLIDETRVLWDHGQDGECLVGRSSSCAVQIRHSTVSKRHCLLERRGDSFTFVDAGSTSGLELNGNKVGPRQPRPLQPRFVESRLLREFASDEVRIGDHSLSLLVDGCTADEEARLVEERLGAARATVEALHAGAAEQRDVLEASLRGVPLPSRALRRFACDCLARRIPAALLGPYLRWIDDAAVLDDAFDARPTLAAAADLGVGRDMLAALQWALGQRHPAEAACVAAAVALPGPTRSASVATDGAATRNAVERSWQSRRLAERIGEQLDLLAGPDPARRPRPPPRASAPYAAVLRAPEAAPSVGGDAFLLAWACPGCVLSSGGRSLWLDRLESKERSRLAGTGGAYVAIAASGPTLAALERDGSLEVWRLLGGVPQPVFRVPPGVDFGRSLAIAPDGSAVAMGSGGKPGEREIVTQEWVDDREREYWGGLPIPDGHWTEQRRWVGSAPGDNGVDLVPLAEGAVQRRRIASHCSPVDALGMTSSGVLSVSQDGVAHFTELDGSLAWTAAVGRSPCDCEVRGPTRFVLPCEPEGVWLDVCPDRVTVRRLRDGEAVTTHRDHDLTAAALPSGTLRLFVGDAAGVVKILEIPSLREVHRWQAHARRVRAIAVSPLLDAAITTGDVNVWRTWTLRLA